MEKGLPGARHFVSPIRGVSGVHELLNVPLEQMNMIHSFRWTRRVTMTVMYRGGKTYINLFPKLGIPALMAHSRATLTAIWA